MAKIVDEGTEDLLARSRRMEFLNGCLKKLPESRRSLVLQAYAPGCSLKALAERLGKSQEGLYQLLRRIRLELQRCVDLHLAQDGERTR